MTPSFSRLLSALAAGMPATAAPTIATTGSPRRATLLTVTFGTLRDLIGHRRRSCEILHGSLGNQLRGRRAVTTVPPHIGLPHQPAVECFQFGGQRNQQRLAVGGARQLYADRQPAVGEPRRHIDRRPG